MAAWTGSTSPGGLVTAFEPVMHAATGRGSAGTAHRTKSWTRSRTTACSWSRSRFSARRSRDYYEGFSNATLWPLYHDAIARPEFHREWWDAYVKVNQRFADQTAKIAEAACGGLGPGLPAPAGAPDAARAATRPADRLLPAHPVPAHRALQPAAVAESDPAGPAGRRPGRIPAARRRTELRPAGPAAAAPGNPSGSHPPSPTVVRCWPGPTPSRSTRRPVTRCRRARRPRTGPRRSGATSATRTHLPWRGPTRLHQRPAGAYPGVRRADRRG